MQIIDCIALQSMCRSMQERAVQEQELMHESEQQPASESESMGVRRLPGGQNELLLPRVRELPRVRRSLGAKVAARERGALSGPGSLPERARIAEVAKDAEASATCKKLCVMSEGLARRRIGLSLGGRLFIAVWITGRGVSELPWIAGRSDHVRSTDVPQSGDGLDIVMESLQELCRSWMVLQGEESHKKKHPVTE